MLYIHRSERADRLADALGELLATPLPDPFAAEVVAVPTRGIERWLTQRLSARLGSSPEREDGVCANIDFPFPGRLIGGSLAIGAGIAPDDDPWLPERMVWPLIGVIEDVIDEPWLAPLAGHLESGRERRFARLRQLARLYDQYSTRRPELIQSWARGEDLGGGWQAELWRRLRDTIGVPSGAERLRPACERLRAEPGLLALPERIALFGLTRLPAGHVEALHAIAAGRDVHLMLLHPSPALWDRIEPPASLPLRAEDPTAATAVNRLLASWGRDARELQVVLGAGGPLATGLHHALPDPDAPATLLEALQADIRADRQPPGPPLPGGPDARPALAPDDSSVRIHACHGRVRQVEVLREAILHRLADDPTLEPRDVIVMCPDIETFAPLIQATFGSGAEADLGEARPTDLRVRLADRSLRQTNPLLGVLARLLELAHARLTASQLLDLADSEPVRRRFGLDDDDLTRIQDWIAAGEIHWGLDGAHRRDYQLEAVETGTWSVGIRRLLLGVAMSESGQRLYEGVLPVDRVESGAIELAGRLAELVDRLDETLRSLAGPHTVRGWAAALAAGADGLTQVAERDGWQRRELDGLLTAVIAEAAGAAASTRLTLPEIRSLLGGRLEGRPTRANFRSGHLTVCTLVPMRSVPHRVVCLLGLDDGAFPRRTPRNGDDLLLERPRVGDRDPRSEDRQLLLDALMAAGEALIITYSGNDERTNAPRPPAVPVGELLDAIDATVRTEPDAAGPARERVLIRHPLQPFDRRNFEAGELIGAGPWSFDPVALDGARALELPRRGPRLFLDAPLPAPPDSRTLELSELIAFVERPPRAFLRQRLGLVVGAEPDEPADALPVTLGPLETWGVGQRLLEGLLAGVEPRDCALAEIARGTLPPGALGEPVMAVAWPRVRAIAHQAVLYTGSTEPRSVETNVVLPDGVRLTGTVSGVHGHVLVTVSYSRLNPRHRLAAWVRLLALSAAHPEVAYEVVTVGRGGQDRVAVARIAPLDRDPATRAQHALAELQVLAALRAEGMREPLPLPSLTAAAYAHAELQTGEDPIAAAAQAWESTYDWDKEDREPEHQLVFSGELPAIDQLGRYAVALWRPLLARETVEER